MQTLKKITAPLVAVSGLLLLFLAPCSTFRLALIAAAAAFVGYFAWTWKSKKRGEALYARLKELKSKMK